MSTPQQTAQPLSQNPPVGEGWWPFLQRARRELEAAGATFATDAETLHFVENLRGDFDPVDAAYWEQEWRNHHGDDSGC